MQSRASNESAPLSRGARIGRRLLGFACTIAVSINLVLPSLADAASMIAQKPLLTMITPAPNVMLMMDDSGSMASDWLPNPTDFNYGTFYNAPGVVSGWTDIVVQDGGGATVPMPSWEILRRTPILNPIGYNPAVTYKPWNDDNKPAASNFPPADIGSYAGASFIGGTRMDMRHVMVAGARVPVDTSVHYDLFRRPGWTRNGNVCMATATRAKRNCVANPYSENGWDCTDDPVLTEEYCSAYNTLPSLIPARYFRYVGATWADRYTPASYHLVEIDRDAPARTYPVPTDPRTGAVVTRVDCAGVTVCTFDEEAHNYANWFTYYRTRLFSAVAVTSNVMSGLSDNMRLGFGRINYFANGPQQWAGYPSTAPGASLPDVDGQPATGHVVRGVRDFTVGSPERSELFDWLFQLNANGWTPNREAIDAAGKYFSRSDAQGPWSDNPGVGPAGVGADKACRRTYTILATDGGWTDESAHPQIQSLGGIWGSGPTESDSVLGPPILGSGGQSGRNYQYDPAAEKVFGSASALQSSTFTDVAHFYWSHDLRPDLSNVKRPIAWPGGAALGYPTGYEDPSTWQNMSTMIIGYGLESSIATADIKAALRDGTTISWPASVNVGDPNNYTKVIDTQRAAIASRGDFYTATSAADLGIALTSAFERVQAQQAAAASLAVSSAVIQSVDDLVYEAGYNAGSWTGSLRGLEALQLVNGVRTERWVASIPPTIATRNIATSAARTAGVDFQWVNLSTANQGLIGDLQTFEYLRGDQSNEMPVGTLRSRDSVLGTIVHSTPLYSKAANFNYQAGPTAGGTNYSTWVDSKRSTRRATVMVNANDGMMHAFDAATGVELFAFVPRATLPRIGALASPSYDHQYLVDGQLTEGDIHQGGSWKTIVVGAGGAGSRSLFALDVSDPDAFSPTKVLFDLDETDEADLGHIMGRPLIASTRAGKWVAIVGNGYESATHRAKLLVIDLADGSVLRTIDTGVGADVAGQRNGLGPVTPIYDRKRDVVGLYAGDKLGNLWKFDLSSASASSWDIARVGAAPAGPLFTATDPLGVVQPITSEVRVSPHPLGGLYLSFGTGQFFETGDPANTQVQSIYMLRDRSDTATITKSQLQLTTLTDVAGGYRSLSGLSSLDWASQKGWYLNLKVGAGAGGERIIATPVSAAGKVSFSSFKPAALDPCDTAGQSHLYIFDLATGMSRNAFEGQTAEVIGRRLEDGVLGGAIPLYAPGTSAGAAVNQIDATQLSGLSDSTRYKVVGGVVSGGASGSICASGAVSLSRSALAVPTQCSGTMPLRMWRDMR